jgi:hypothetical protein
LQLEIDRLGVTILERIVEGLIDVIDQAEGDTDLEDGAESEPDADDGPCAFCWVGGGEGRETAPRRRRQHRASARRPST